MTFEALAQLHADYAVGNGDKESIQWRPSTKASDTSPVDDVNVVVEWDPDPLRDEDIAHDADTPSPIVIHLAKSDVSTVHLGRGAPDRFVLNGGEYRVSAVLAQDPGMWELYCVK